LASLCTTIVSIDVLSGAIITPMLWTGCWFFFIRRSELTKPIAADSIVFSIVVLCSVTVDILYFRRAPHVFGVVLATVAWISIMICIYYEWWRFKKLLPNKSPEPTPVSAGSSASRTTP